MPAMLSNACTEPEYGHGMCRSIRGLLTGHPKTVKCTSQKVDCVTYGSTFNFRSCAYYFPNKITLNSYMLHVLTLCSVLKMLHSHIIQTGLECIKHYISHFAYMNLD
jgi:hypothetical protein